MKLKTKDVDAFKSWLVRRLVLIKKANSDVDALSRYVVALVRRNESVEELNRLCVERLYCFFDGKTQLFVDIVFEGLCTKAYLTNDDIEDRLTPDDSTTDSSPPDVKPTRARLTSIMQKHKSSEEDAGCENVTVSSSYTGWTTASPPKRARKSRDIAHERHVYQQGAALCIREDNTSSDVAFGFYIGTQLNELPNSYAKEKVKLDIQQLLAKAQFPKLRTEDDWSH